MKIKVILNSQRKSFISPVFHTIFLTADNRNHRGQLDTASRIVQDPLHTTLNILDRELSVIIYIY